MFGEEVLSTSRKSMPAQQWLLSSYFITVDSCCGALVSAHTLFSLFVGLISVIRTIWASHISLLKSFSLVGSSGWERDCGSGRKMSILHQIKVDEQFTVGWAWVAVTTTRGDLDLIVPCPIPATTFPISGDGESCPPCPAQCTARQCLGPKFQVPVSSTPSKNWSLVCRGKSDGLHPPWPAPLIPRQALQLSNRAL